MFMFILCLDDDVFKNQRSISVVLLMAYLVSLLTLHTYRSTKCL